MTTDEDHPPIYPEDGSLQDDIANLHLASQHEINPDSSACAGTDTAIPEDTYLNLPNILCFPEELGSRPTLSRNLLQEHSNLAGCYSGSSYRNYAKFAETPLTTSMFSAIHLGQNDLLDTLVSSGMIGLDARDVIGRTPLVAAVESGQYAIIQQLMDYGADINELSAVSDVKGEYQAFRNGDKNFVDLNCMDVHRRHTPLMAAATRGNLTLVKLLMETFQADDKIIANDGETALRLAAANGHREVVQYLPTVRGGGIKRWKWKNKAAYRRVCKAAKGIYHFVRVCVYDIPRFFVWSIPKHVIVIPIRDGVKWLNKHRANLFSIFVNWVKRTAISIAKTIIKIPKTCWQILKVIVKDIIWGLLKYLYRFVFKKVPRALKYAYEHIIQALKHTWEKICHFIGRVVSAIHTLVLKVFHLIENLTWADVARGFKEIGIWIVSLPKMIGQGVLDILLFANKFIHKCFDSWIFSCLADAFMITVLYIPLRLLRILGNLGDILGRGIHEIRVFFNPKAI